MCKKSGKMPKNILYNIFFRLVIIKKTTKFAGEKIKSTVVDDGNTIFFTLLILKYLGIKGGFIKVRPFFFFGNQWLEKKLKDIPFGLKAAMTKIIKIVTCRDCQKLR